jgi:hypothetical protein
VKVIIHFSLKPPVLTYIWGVPLVLAYIFYIQDLRPAFMIMTKGKNIGIVMYEQAKMHDVT